MLLKILQYIRGYLTIRVSGHSAERFLNACRHRGIQLWDLRPAEDAYEMNISIRGFRKIRPIVRKTGAKVIITGRIGFPFFLQKYRRRKLFFAGAGLCLSFIYIWSCFIWSIDIRGNLTRTDETLLEFLETKNIHSGMRSAQIDCARIVKDIRKEYNDIIWVSASIEGSKLIIQIQENEDVIQTEGETAPEAEDTQTKESAPLDIVADKDCVITSIITRRGIPMVKEGAAVKAGDILVSGQVPVNNDAGEVTAYHYQESDADIMGQTTLTYEDTQSLQYEEKELTDINKPEYFVRFGDFRFSFGSIKNNYKHFEQYSKEVQLALSDSFKLPVSVGKRNVIPYEVSKKTYSKETYQRMLSERFFRYCEDLQKKGVEIIQNDVKIYTGSESASAKGTLTVKMSVGELKPSQLIEIPKIEEENEQAGEE